MIQNVLTKIGGISHYGVISICLFFVCFLGALVWACRLKRSYLDSMRELPLDDDATPNPDGDSRHE
jgi:cbb3-type cytochrome oxidase subunit 3